MMKLYFDFSREFWILCLVVFLYFFSFNAIIPQLSDYLTLMGGEDYKGLIIGAFALSALGTRPFSGKLVDIIGRKPIMLIGIFVSILILFIYPIIHGVAIFLFLRFLHGISAGCTPTATTAFCSDIVSVEKRGQAMGMVGMAGNLGMSMGPALGSEVAVTYSNEAMFMVAGVFAFFALIPAFRLRETQKNAIRFDRSMLLLKRDEIIEPRVLVVGVVMALTVLSFGAILTLIPDYCLSFGIEKNGYFFTVITVTSVIVRLFSGSWSDKFGREIMLLWGILVLIVADVMLALANSTEMVFAAAAVFGVATGINSPTLFAWTIDLGNAKFIGRGISTLFIFLEGGIILGSVIPAAIYHNKTANLPTAFMFTAGCAVIAWMVVFRAFRRRHS